ncbi:hypothetical protein ACFLUH_02875 [Chloroflexota bacterium]
MNQSNSTESIYRFDSYSHFRDTIKRKALALVHYSLWNDPEEGLIFKLCNNGNGRTIVNRVLGKLLPSKSDLDIQFIIVELQSIRRCIHAQSWTKIAENEIFWGMHSNDDCIRLEVSRENINRLNQVTTYDIEYKDTSIEEELHKIVDAGPNKMQVISILLRKATKYSYEQEVRLISDVDLDYLPGRSPKELAFMKAGVLAQYKGGHITLDAYKSIIKELDTEFANSIRNIRYIDFQNMPNFIKSVMVHPKATDPLVQRVKDDCLNNNIPFLGRSQLAL